MAGVFTSSRIMSSFYISAAHKSSGKTTLSIGLSAAIRQRGINIQTFKKGPDYIDPIWLGQASENPCYNLDFFTSSNDFIIDLFSRQSAEKQVNLVEGNMGLYDGISVDGSDCNAAMAKLLGLPVILVVDCSGTSRGIAPLLLGYQQFDPEVKFAGVILNKLAGQRQEKRLTEVIHNYTDFQVLGALPRNAQVGLTERHLGLIPSNEVEETSEETIQLLAEQVVQHVDIDKILSLPRVESEQSATSVASSTLVDPKKPIRIAIARDKAFGFYYPGDLERFEQLGIELVPFNAALDSKLPKDIDGLFIGGGFPETQVEALVANQSMRDSIKKAIDDGLPTYAECGGLMYLCRDLMTDDGNQPMCGVIPASVSMNKKPQGRGYVILKTTPDHPWYAHSGASQKTIHAHEFHYSRLEDFKEYSAYAYSIDRGTGIDGLNDGIIYRNLVANYSHLRQTDQCSWVDDFVLFVDKLRN